MRAGDRRVRGVSLVWISAGFAEPARTRRPVPFEARWLAVRLFLIIEGPCLSDTSIVYSLRGRTTPRNRGFVVGPYLLPLSFSAPRTRRPGAVCPAQGAARRITSRRMGSFHRAGLRPGAAPARASARARCLDPDIMRPRRPWRRAANPASRSLAGPPAHRAVYYCHRTHPWRPSTAIPRRLGPALWRARCGPREKARAPQVLHAPLFAPLAAPFSGPSTTPTQLLAASAAPWLRCTAAPPPRRPAPRAAPRSAREGSRRSALLGSHGPLVGHQNSGSGALQQRLGCAGRPERARCAGCSAPTGALSLRRAHRLASVILSGALVRSTPF